MVGGVQVGEGGQGGGLAGYFTAREIAKFYSYTYTKSFLT